MKTIIDQTIAYLTRRCRIDRNGFDVTYSVPGSLAEDRVKYRSIYEDDDGQGTWFVIRCRRGQTYYEFPTRDVGELRGRPILEVVVEDSTGNQCHEYISATGIALARILF